MEENDAYVAEIEKRLATLPADIQELVYSSDMTGILTEIGKKHGLHIDQIGDLETETVGVMIGLDKMEEFASNIADSLELDEAKSAAIVKDINDQLFIKIRESLKKLYEKPAAGVIVNPPYTPPTPAPAPMPPPVIKPMVPAPPNPAARSGLPGAPAPKSEPSAKQTVSVKPALPVEMHEALSAPVVSTPQQPATNNKQPATGEPKATDKEEAPKPAAYKTVDPYREIPE